MMKKGLVISRPGKQLLKISLLKVKLRRGSGMALYIGECFNVVEIRVGNERVEFLWIRIKGLANKVGILMAVCNRLRNQDEEMDEVFYKQLAEVPQSPVLVLLGTLTYQTCWK